jgi:flagellar motor switch protein FliN
MCPVVAVFDAAGLGLIGIGNCGKSTPDSPLASRLFESRIQRVLVRSIFHCRFLRSGADLGAGEERVSMATQSKFHDAHPSQGQTAAMPFQLREFGRQGAAAEVALETADHREVELGIELGHTAIDDDQLTALDAGSVVTLDELVDDPVDIFVSGRRIAQGQLLSLDNKFCVRVTKVVNSNEAA